MTDLPDRNLVSLFAKAVRRLGQAGQPEEASTLAAQAWWALKDNDPRGAEHVNGVMHYLAGLEESVRPPTAAEAATPAAPDPDA